MKPIQFISSFDTTKQDAFFYSPAKAKKEPVPLVVGLHQWSFSYDEPHNRPEYYKEAKKRGWAFVYPNFRGPNNTPQACASELAQRDILDSIDYARANAQIDLKRIYLVGASGGAMMALFMAGKYPEIWAAVSAWCPIIDLKAWYNEGLTLGNVYPDMIKACCGGRPGDSKEIDRQYRIRSPKTYLKGGVDIWLDINAGIHDGHEGSVPITHSLLGFNILAKTAKQNDKIISPADIKCMVKEQIIPRALKYRSQGSLKRKHEILFRRSSAKTRITVFDGGHEGDPPMAFRFFEKKELSTST